MKNLLKGILNSKMKYMHSIFKNLKLNGSILLILSFIAFVANFLYISFMLQGGSPGKFEIDFNHQYSINNNSNIEKQISNQNISYVTSRIVNDTTFEILIPGKEPFLAHRLSELLNNKLHISQKLALYSLGYTQTVLNELLNEKDSILLKNLKQTVFEVVKHLETKSIIPDRMKFNDHVVSYRIEQLLLFRSLSDSLFKNDNDFLKLINKQIEWDIKFLLDDKYFTWKSNHGLMQIRALLSYAYFSKGKAQSQKAIQKANERLNELLEYHFASDGSIYESASGYWFFVYSQWHKFLSYSGISDTLKIKITNRLKKSEFFLNSITNGQGFIQGVGDSYNGFKNIITQDNKENSAFLFKNGTSGFDLVDSLGNVLSISFNSLHNPPNVHKHPEDLSFYLYLNEPFFINPGTFSADNSQTRKYVTSTIPQNTVLAIDKNRLDSSRIKRILYDEKSESFVFEGSKWYSDIELKRCILFNPRLLLFTINDTSLFEIRTQFNIHPNIKVRWLDSLNVNLYTNNDSVLFSSSNPIQHDSVFISDKLTSVRKVLQIWCQGNNNIRIQVLSPLYVDDNIKVTENNIADSKRFLISKVLEKKYSKSEFLTYSTNKFIFFRVIIFIGLFILLLFFQYRGSRWRIYIFLFYIALMVLDTLTLGFIISNII